MKTNRPVTQRQEQQHERALFTAILALRSVEECRSFFRDLCTPTELQAMADRWAVVELLERGLPYRDIHTPDRRERHHHRPRRPLSRVRQWRLSCGHRPPEARRMSAHDPAVRLKIAVQKSGRLTDSSLDLLSRCGLKYSRGKDQLMCYGENMPLDVLFVRDDDIPDLVQEDVCDLGRRRHERGRGEAALLPARGRSRRCSRPCGPLDFGRCRLCIAVPDGFDYRGAASLEGKRIATTYPHILGRFLAERGMRAEVVVLSGSVEIAPRLGRADVICDLVSTGSTLAANHLRQAEVVLESQAVLIRTPVPDTRREAGLDPPPVHAHRRRGTGQGQQVHHAARPALRRCPRSRSSCPEARRRR